MDFSAARRPHVSRIIPTQEHSEIFKATRMIYMKNNTTLKVIPSKLLFMWYETPEDRTVPITDYTEVQKKRNWMMGGSVFGCGRGAMCKITGGMTADAAAT